MGNVTQPSRYPVTVDHQDMRNKAIAELRKALLELDASTTPASLKGELKHDAQFQMRVQAQMRFQDAAKPWVIRELLNRLDACSPEKTQTSEDLGEAVTLLSNLTSAVSADMDLEWDDSEYHPGLKPAHLNAREWLLEREILRYAEGIFAADAETAEWLRKPHPSLAGRPPLEVAQEPAGLAQVLSILNAIKHGGVV